MSDQVHASLEELRTLVKLIKTSVDTIEKTFLTNNQPFPSLDGPSNPQSEAIRMSPGVQQAGNVLIAASSQLIANVRPPSTTAFLTSIQVRILLLSMWVKR